MLAWSSLSAKDIPCRGPPRAGGLDLERGPQEHEARVSGWPHGILTRAALSASLLLAAVRWRLLGEARGRPRRRGRRASGRRRPGRRPAEAAHRRLLGDGLPPPRSGRSRNARARAAHGLVRPESPPTGSPACCGCSATSRSRPSAPPRTRTPARHLRRHADRHPRASPTRRARRSSWSRRTGSGMRATSTASARPASACVCGSSAKCPGAFARGLCSGGPARRATARRRRLRRPHRGRGHGRAVARAPLPPSLRQGRRVPRRGIAAASCRGPRADQLGGRLLPPAAGRRRGPCRAGNGKLQNGLCAGGACQDLGALGLCSLDCAARPCPDGARCAAFNRRPAQLCLRTCGADAPCREDPLLACAAPGRAGPLGFKVMDAPAGPRSARHGPVTSTPSARPRGSRGQSRRKPLPAARDGRGPVSRRPRSRERGRDEQRAREQAAGSRPRERVVSAGRTAASAPATAPAAVTRRPATTAAATAAAPPPRARRRPARVGEAALERAAEHRGRGDARRADRATGSDRGHAGRRPIARTSAAPTTPRPAPIQRARPRGPSRSAPHDQIRRRHRAEIPAHAAMRDRHRLGGLERRAPRADRVSASEEQHREHPARRRPHPATPLRLGIEGLLGPPHAGVPDDRGGEDVEEQRACPPRPSSSRTTLKSAVSSMNTSAVPTPIALWRSCVRSAAPAASPTARQDRTIAPPTANTPNPKAGIVAAAPPARQSPT